MLTNPCVPIAGELDQLSASLMIHLNLRRQEYCHRYHGIGPGSSEFGVLGQRRATARVSAFHACIASKTSAPPNARVNMTPDA